MKILYFVYMFPDYKNKSKGIFIYNRVKELKKKGIFIQVVKINPIIKRNFTINFEKSYSTKDIGLDHDIKVTVINYIKFPFGLSIFLLNKVKNIFIKNKFDLIHGHFASQCYYLYKLNKKYKIPYIITSHGSDIHTAPYLSKMIKRNIENVLNRAKMIIFVSTFLYKESLKLNYYNKNYKIIPNGIERFFINNKLINEKRKKKKYTIVFIGNLVRIKGADLLPEIFDTLLKLEPNIRFKIIGEGNLKKYIIKKLKTYKILHNVDFTGIIKQKEILKILTTVDILIAPSRNEGFSCVIIEANACGVPVIGSKIGAIPETIGNGGIVVNHDNNFIINFSNAVITLLKNPIDKNMLRKKVKNLTWDKIIEKEIEIYRKIIKNINKK